MMRYINNLLLLTVLLFLTACSTKRNTFVSRNYHDLTAHYNVYFNGNESFKAGAKKVEQINKDNYAQLLDVFPSSKKENLDAVSSEMDVAIQKGVKLVKKHSITVKPNSSSYAKKHPNQKEYNNWVDDGYLLVAKAHFYKREYADCVNTCKLIIRDYPNTPSKHEAIIWMGRALIEMGAYDDAKTTLDGYDISTGAPRSLLSFYMASMADLNIRNEHYNDAIPYIKQAIEEEKKKNTRIRYQYILAQLYHSIGNESDAANAYLKVIEMNPKYEIAFNAKVKRGSILMAGSSTEEIKKELYKLLNNKKNYDYRDRIFYALGKVSLVEKNDEEALKNFTSSVDANKDNPYQKAVSYIAMADIFYKQEAFKKSYLAYNNAVNTLDPTAKEYKSLNSKTESLKKITDNLETIAYEDSVQLVAKLSPKDQEAYVLKMIDNKKREIAEREKARQDSIMNSQLYGDSYNQYDNQTSPEVTGSAGKWYFYNPVIVSQGKVEFEKRWGKRALEDNWRRSNKQTVMPDATNGGFPEDPDATNTSSANNSDNGKLINKEQKDKGTTSNNNGILSKEEYLKNIPNTAESLNKSHENIETSFFALGRTFADELKDYPNSIKSINELERRYPKSAYMPEYLMQQYQNYEASRDSVGKERIRAQIIKNYPNSEFALYFSDPDYVKKYALKKHTTDSVYQEVYRAYLLNDFYSALNGSENYMKAMPQNHLADKFLLIESLCQAKLGNIDLFKTNLERVVSGYPNGEATPLATQLLAQLNKGITPVKVAPLTPPTKSLLHTSTSSPSADSQINNYTFPDTTAMMVVVVVNNGCDKNRLAYNIADYNFERYIIKDFDQSLQNWGDKNIIKIEPFGNLTEAMEYFYAIREHIELFKVNNLNAYNVLVISQENYAKMISGGGEESYMKFFNEKYLKSSGK